MRWHDLRHSFASQLATNGVPLRRIQEWLGHSTIHMTMRYAHLAPSGDADLLATLDATSKPEARAAGRQSS
jgi:site-specific recombinase XerD